MLLPVNCWRPSRSPVPLICRQPHYPQAPAGTPIQLTYWLLFIVLSDGLTEIRAVNYRHVQQSAETSRPIAASGRNPLNRGSELIVDQEHACCAVFLAFQHVSIFAISWSNHDSEAPDHRSRNIQLNLSAEFYGDFCNSILYSYCLGSIAPGYWDN